MSGIYHEAFVPHNSQAEEFCAEQANESDLFLATPPDHIAPSDSDWKERNKKTLRLYYEAVNFQHLSGIARLFSPAFVNHSEEGDTFGVEAVIEALQSITFALPDLQMNLQFVVAERDRVATHGTYIGTYQRPFKGAMASGDKITWPENLMWRLDEDSKIVERWQETVPVTLLQQLGVATLKES